MYLTLKVIHIIFAAVAIAGFLLRGYWLFSGSKLRHARATKTLPHINDTLFLASGIALVVVLDLPWTQLPWLLAKFAGLGLYIGFGMIAFRFGRSTTTRIAAFVAAILAFSYVVGAALSKSAASWFSTFL